MIVHHLVLELIERNVQIPRDVNGSHKLAEVPETARGHIETGAFRQHALDFGCECRMFTQLTAHGICGACGAAGAFHIGLRVSVVHSSSLRMVRWCAATSTLSK